jgi:hypothetical protein
MSDRMTRSSGWKTGPHLGAGRTGADRQSWPRPASRPNTPPIHIPKEIPTKKEVRLKGRCEGFHSLDKWGLLKPDFAPDKRVIVSASDIRGGTLRPGQRVSFTIDDHLDRFGHLVARDVWPLD